MGEIVIEVNKEDLMNILSEKASQLDVKAEEMVVDISDEVEVNMKIEAPEAPRDCDGGNLKSNINVQTISPLHRLVKSEAEYTKYVIDGTPPHLINSPIYICGGVGWRFIVEHPGTQPNDFVDRAEKKSQDYAQRRRDELLAWLVS